MSLKEPSHREAIAQGLRRWHKLKRLHGREKALELLDKERAAARKPSRKGVADG